MSKYFIFNIDNCFKNIAATDEAKDISITVEPEGSAVIATDEQFNAVRRELATVSYDGTNLTYSLLDPVPNFESKQLNSILENKIKRVEEFNKYNSNSLSVAYENKLKDLLRLTLLQDGINEENFPNLENSHTFDNWYFNQPNFPDFSDLEIY